MGPLWREDPKTCVFFFFQDNMSTKTKTYMKKDKNMALYGNKSLSDFFFPKDTEDFLFCFAFFCLILPYHHFKTFHLIWCGVPHFTDP